VNPAPAWTVQLSGNPLLAAWQALAVVASPTPVGSNKLIHHLQSAAATMAREHGKPAPPKKHQRRDWERRLDRIQGVVLPNRLKAGRWLLRRFGGSLAHPTGRSKPTLDRLASFGLSDSNLNQAEQIEQDVWRESAPVVFLAAALVTEFEVKQGKLPTVYGLFTEWDWVEPVVQAADTLVKIATSFSHPPADPAKRVELILPRNFGH
jgi:hypothetical protein